MIQFPTQQVIDRVKYQRKIWRKKVKNEYPLLIKKIKARVPTKFTTIYNLEKQILKINFDTEVEEIIDLTEEIIIDLTK